MKGEKRREYLVPAYQLVCHWLCQCLHSKALVRKLSEDVPSSIDGHEVAIPLAD